MSAEGIYPFATQGGNSIPLDIVKPSSLVCWDLVANVKQNITIPAGASTAWIYSAVDAILSFSTTLLPNTLVATTVYDHAVFIPADTFVNILVTPGAASIVGLAAGRVYLNTVVQWGALAQAKQTSTQ